MKKKPGSRITLMNMITGLLLQICLIVSSLVIPRIILHYFGSDTNGLVASINQLLNYITLVEGGLTAVVTASLYKPLVDKDSKALSRVMKTTGGFYRKIGLVFVAYAVVLAVIYPILFGMNIPYTTTLVLILALTNLIHYVFSLTYQVLLIADKRQYVVSLTQMAIIISGVVLAVISVQIYPNIHLLLGIIGSLYVIQPLVLGSYIRKHYSVDKEADEDKKLLKERWNGFAINISAFVHNNTDIVILTFFKDLFAVSVYSVYSLVTLGIRSIVTSITNGITPVIGQSYAKGDIRVLKKQMDLYEYIVLTLVFFISVAGALLITPFVMLYTSGVNDADYCQPVFGYLIIAGEAVYLLKKPHIDLAFAADKFKETRIPAYIETAINIVISLILVKPLGLTGVAIGTLAAMIWRTVFHIDLAGKIIKGRGSLRYYLKILLFAAASAVGFAICKVFIPVANKDVSLWNWIIHAVIYCAVFAAIYLLISLTAFRCEFNGVLNYLRKGSSYDSDNKNGAEEVDPIDLVYLYVNSNDPEWQAERSKCAAVCGYDDPECRYRDNGELYYSLKSVRLYAPWINHIYIVTNSKMPDWFDENDPWITVVQHSEIMPEEILPCFNVNVIETFIPKIPGLSEFFLYANDDMFLGNYVSRDFFVRDGKPVVRMFKMNFDPGNPGGEYEQNILNTMKLFTSRYGREYKLNFSHGIDIYTKSSMEACISEFESDFRRIADHHFRTSEDILRVIFQYFMIANDLCYLKVYDHSNIVATGLDYLKILWDPESNFDIACWGMHDFARIAVFRCLLLAGPKLACLNDEENTTAKEIAVYREYMEKLFRD